MRVRDHGECDVTSRGEEPEYAFPVVRDAIVLDEDPWTFWKMLRTHE